MNLRFETEHWVPFPIELVFAFFANPGNLPHLMPGWQKVRMEEQRIVPAPERPLAVDPARRFRSPAAGKGTELLISFRPIPLSPIRWPWESVITEFEWNEHFCDEQVRGPFRFWHHCHRTIEDNHGEAPGTIIRDEVEYGLPWGGLGETVNKLVVTRQIRSLFSFRQKRLAEILAAAARQAVRRA